MARRRKKKNQVKLSSTAIKVILVFMLVVAIALGTWYLVDKDGFMGTYEKLLSMLNPTPPPDEVPEPLGDKLKVHFIDVGQGDAIYMQLPDGKDMLIDAGDRDSDITADLLDYLNGLGTLVDGLDYLMLTHTDSDHVGGMDEVLENYVVKKVFMPNVGAYEEDEEIGFMTNTTTYVPFYQAVQAESGIEVVYNQGQYEITGEGYKIKVYCPSQDFYVGVDKDSSAQIKNNMSPVCVLEYGEEKTTRVVLTGDLNSNTTSPAHAWSERHFMEQIGGTLFDCDILKVGHHGSDGSTSTEFLNFIDPEHVVVSVGADNSHGHPDSVFIERVNAYGLQDATYRTDLKGDIVLTIGSNGGYSFEFAK